MSQPAITPSPNEILHARALVLAAEPARLDEGGPRLSVIEFALADERYALEMNLVGEVYPLEHLTPLPCTPNFLAGIINVRGRIVAVIDLKKFFDLPDRGISDLHRVILVQDDDSEFGILADHVIATREIPMAGLQPPLPTHNGTRADYLKGITEGRLIVLDAARILADSKLSIDETPAG